MLDRMVGRRVVGKSRMETRREGENRPGGARSEGREGKKEEKRWDPLKIETHRGGDRNFGPRKPASLEEAFAKMR